MKPGDLRWFNASLFNDYNGAVGAAAGVGGWLAAGATVIGYALRHAPPV